MKAFIKKYKKRLGLVVKILSVLLIVFISNYYLQLMQNDFSWSLATKFAFSWHSQKFFLGCLVLLIFLLFLISLIGSWVGGISCYSVGLGLLGFANYQKMAYRLEPIYPDDLKMITELGLMKEMIGTIPFVLCLVFLGLAIGSGIYALYRSFFLARKKQIIRLSSLLICLLLLSYIGQFNQPTNLLRKAYDKTALWIPYSQKMNYYNTGFMGGFLYNLKVTAMEKPEGYSAQKINEIVKRYQPENVSKEELKEQPNIVYIMSESFSDPLRLTGLKTTANPLAAYKQVANTTYSGQMLSQNYGGGTANIEFEALTGFSMEPFNSQLTTPYTMLVPTLEKIPSLVSRLNTQGYETTAIHPYNTSMYKRKDVYEVFGFQQFIDETTMTYQDKIGNNPYIADQAAYQEILDLLKEEQPQFAHLVTMQTHMPYKDKYEGSGDVIEGVDNPATMDSYLQDIAYASQALADFLEELKSLPNRTLVVFWGDHLPSIYTEEYQQANSEVDLHLTEFLIWDSQEKLGESAGPDLALSPVYFSAKLAEMASLPESGFYRLLNELEQVLPAFEKNFYLQKGQWTKKMALSKKDQAIYRDYQLIQYDIVAGKQYSLRTDFFNE